MCCHSALAKLPDTFRSLCLRWGHLFSCTIKSTNGQIFTRVKAFFSPPSNYALNIATYLRTPFNKGDSKIHNQTLTQEHSKCYRKCCYMAIISHNHGSPYSPSFSVSNYTTTAPRSRQEALGLQPSALYKHKPKWWPSSIYSSLIISCFSHKLYPLGVAPDPRHFWSLVPRELCQQLLSLWQSLPRSSWGKRCSLAQEVIFKQFG